MPQTLTPQPTAQPKGKSATAKPLNLNPVVDIDGDQKLQGFELLAQLDVERSVGGRRPILNVLQYAGVQKVIEDWSTRIAKEVKSAQDRPVQPAEMQRKLDQHTVEIGKIFTDRLNQRINEYQQNVKKDPHYLGKQLAEIELSKKPREEKNAARVQLQNFAHFAANYPNDFRRGMEITGGQALLIMRHVAPVPMPRLLDHTRGDRRI